jgi:ribose transport system permease protein
MDIVINRLVSWRQQMYLVAPVLLVIFLCALIFMHRSGVSPQAALDIITRVVKEGAPFALMACGSSLVIAAGSIDLSVAGSVAISGAIFATLTQLTVPPILAGLVSIIFGLAIGWCLGAIITQTRCPALIMSWSVGVLGLLAAVLFGGLQVVRGTPSSIPLGFVTAPDFWDFPSLGFVSALACVLVSTFVLNWSNFPTYCCAVGADRKAALYAGIDTKKVQRSAFALNGLLCAVAGIFFALLANSAVSTEHVGKELIVIAVAVLGGTSLSGGYLSLWSVVASAFFWSAAKTFVDSLDLGLVGSLQSEAASGIFALVLIAVVLVFSRNLVSYEGSVFYRQKSMEAE